MYSFVHGRGKQGRDILVKGGRLPVRFLLDMESALLVFGSFLLGSSFFSQLPFLGKRMIFVMLGGPHILVGCIPLLLVQTFALFSDFFSQEFGGWKTGRKLRPPRCC